MVIRKPRLECQVRRCYSFPVQDTSEQSRARYFELLAQQTPAQRFASARRLTSMVRKLALAGLREAHPDAWEAELRVELARRLYGDDTADRLRPGLLDDWGDRRGARRRAAHRAGAGGPWRPLLPGRKPRRVGAGRAPRDERHRHRDGPFDDSEFARRREVTVADGATLCVKSPEDTVLRKLCWYRDGGEVSDRQWRDVVGVLRLSATGLDLDYLRLWAQQLNVATLLERAQRDAASWGRSSSSPGLEASCAAAWAASASSCRVHLAPSPQSRLRA